MGKHTTAHQSDTRLKSVNTKMIWFGQVVREDGTLENTNLQGKVERRSQ